MKKFAEILFLVLFTLIGFYYLYLTYKSFYETSIIDGFISLILIFMFLLLLGLTFNFNYKKYRITKKIKSFYPVLIGFLFIFSAVFLHLLLWYKDSSDVVLQANYDGDINGASFEFRKDGTYKFDNYSILGGSVFRGKYQIKDSIIILDKNQIDNVIKTNVLAIRNLDINHKGRNQKIVQIDAEHKRIENDYLDFIINIDKR